MIVDTKVIDKIEDVREGDIVICEEAGNGVVDVASGKKVYDHEGGWWQFSESTVVRITVESKSIEQRFTQQQAQEMYEFIERVAGMSDYMVSLNARELLKQLESKNDRQD